MPKKGPCGHADTLSFSRKSIIFVKKSGGIEYTIKKMIDYKTKAMTILENFEDSDYKKSLIKMIDYVVERKI